MKNLSQPQLNTCSSRMASVISAIGFSAIALIGATQSAEAATVFAGKDYLYTPGGGTTHVTLDLGGGNIVSLDLKGLPINPATLFTTDTIVQRFSDVSAPVANTLPVPPVNASASDSITPIQIIDLSLQSENPLDLGGSFFDVFVGLDPGNASTGAVAIAHNPDINSPGGIWSSQFNLNAIAVAVPAALLTPDGTPNFVKNLIATGCSTYLCIPFTKTFRAQDDKWTHAPGPNNFVGPDSTNFFLDGLVIHDAGGGTTHGVKAAVVPTPALLPGLIGMGIAAWRKRRDGSLAAEEETTKVS
jgi:hypothetical protein